MPDNKIMQLAQGIIDRIEASGKKFLDENAGARAFVYERAERLATLGLQYTEAPDDATRQVIDEQIGVVRQSIENELSSVAVNASVEARATFIGIVNDVVGILRTLLPIVVGMLRK